MRTKKINYTEMPITVLLFKTKSDRTNMNGIRY